MGMVPCYVENTGDLIKDTSTIQGGTFHHFTDPVILLQNL